MYIKQMNEISINEFIDKCQQNGLYNIEDINEVYSILTQNKDFIEANFDRLKELWIINWIGPSYFSKNIIKIITNLLDWVKYEWHDIFYFVGWDKEDKLNADIWLLKYSLIWLSKKIKDLEKINLNIILYPIRYILVSLILLYYSFIIYNSFILVRIFWNKAFNFNK